MHIEEEIQSSTSRSQRNNLCESIQRRKKAEAAPRKRLCLNRFEKIIISNKTLWKFCREKWLWYFVAHFGASWLLQYFSWLNYRECYFILLWYRSSDFRWLVFIYTRRTFLFGGKIKTCFAACINSRACQSYYIEAFSDRNIHKD